MRNDAGNTEFETTSDSVADPLAAGNAEHGRSGVRAGILAGLTLGVLSATALTANLSTVVSINTIVA